MGNKLCGPRRANSRRQDTWTPKKDTHLLRLWAEIFRVQADSEEMGWERVSDDVVPVNITCIQDGAETVFQVTAYNRHIHKIFDARISQPGTRIQQANECFIHWKDTSHNCEWGLNFTTAVDARRFHDCCMTHSSSGFSRKSTSAVSLRMSPTKHSPRARTDSLPRRTQSHTEGHPLEHSRSLDLRDLSDIKGGGGGGGGQSVALNSEISVSASGGGGGTVNRKSRVASHAHHDSGFTGEEACTCGLIAHQQDQESLYGGSLAEYNSTTLTGSGLTKRRLYNQTRSQSADAHGDDESAPYMCRGLMDSIDSTTTSETEKSFYSTRYINYQQMLHQQQLYQIINHSRVASKQSQIAHSRETSCSPAHSLRSSTHSMALQLNNTHVHGGYLHTQAPNSHFMECSVDEILEESPPPITTTTAASLNTLPVNIALTTSECESSPDFALDSVALRRILTSFPTVSPASSVCGGATNSEHLHACSISPTICNSSQQRHVPTPVVAPLKFSRQDSLPDSVAESVETKKGKTSICSTTSQTLPSKNLPRGRSCGTLIAENREEVSLESSLQRCPTLGDTCLRVGTNSHLKYDIGGGSCRNVNQERHSTVRHNTCDNSHSQKVKALSSSVKKEAEELDADDANDDADHDNNENAKKSVSNSDSEDDDSSSTSSESSLSTMASESQASIARQAGAIRKAGWLIVKNWLVHKKRKVEQAPKRRWRKYWVCLKGTVLLFYKATNEDFLNEHLLPRHVLVVEGSIAQGMPEHPKREHIFSVSTAFGDAYLLQAPNQTELENWITAVHSACASLFARQHGKSDTLKLLRNEIARLENSIDLDNKMKKMAELQLSVVQDTRSRNSITRQIGQWEENIEKLYIEQYRFRCYMASLHGSELPNPKNILSNVSRSSKLLLSKLNVLNVTAFHALVCARTPLTTAALHHRTRTKRSLAATELPLKNNADADSSKGRPNSAVAVLTSNNVESSIYTAEDSFNEEMTNSAFFYSGSTTNTSNNWQKSDSHRKCEEVNENYVENPDISSTINPESKISENLSNILLPNGQTCVIGIQQGMTVQEIIEIVCQRCKLDARSHFIRLRLNDHGIDIIPDNCTVFENQEFQLAELCAKQLFRTYLARRNGSPQYGMTVEAELLCEARGAGDQPDELCVYVAQVDEFGVAKEAGLMVGDEILMINGRLVSDLDMVYIEEIFERSSSLTLVIRTCRGEAPPGQLMLTEANHHSLLKENCNPAASGAASLNRSDRFECQPLQLAVPSPMACATSGSSIQVQKTADSLQQHNAQSSSITVTVNPGATMNSSAIDMQDERSEEICRHSHSSDSSHSSAQSQKLTPAEKLRKGVSELLETERTYVESLQMLLEMYVLPLRHQIFPQHVDMENLCETTADILQFQVLFLQSLEEAVRLEPDFNFFTETTHFRKLLFSLAGSFLYYSQNFKLYSSFCASHSKCQKLLNAAESCELRDFLSSRNPRQEHSSTLESCLIKPIQRILKYPLLLQQLRAQANPESEEWRQLSEALKGMEAVAEHINEMQKIYDEFGSTFEDLMRIFRECHPNKQPIDLSIGELQMYGTVEWLNASENLGKIKKNIDLYTTCFVFRTGVVLLCRERTRQKRKSRTSATLRGHHNGGDQVRFQTVIHVSEVQVRSSFTSEANTVFLWELIHLRNDQENRVEKIYQLSNCTYEARNDFLRTVRQIIRDSVRRMTVPTAGRCLSPTIPTMRQSVSVQQPTAIMSKSAIVRPTSASIYTIDNNTSVGELPMRQVSAPDSSMSRPSNSNLCVTPQHLRCSTLSETSAANVKNLKRPPPPPQRISSQLSSTSHSLGRPQSANPQCNESVPHNFVDTDSIHHQLLNEQQIQHQLQQQLTPVKACQQKNSSQNRATAYFEMKQHNLMNSNGGSNGCDNSLCSNSLCSRQETPPIPIISSLTASNAASSSTLNSNVDTSRSARLIYSSHNPLHTLHQAASQAASQVSHSSPMLVQQHFLSPHLSGVPLTSADGYSFSPVWKPRSRVTYDMNNPHQTRDTDQLMSASPAYGDYTALSGAESASESSAGSVASGALRSSSTLNQAGRSIQHEDRTAL